jgi:hypothetical protein
MVQHTSCCYWQSHVGELWMHQIYATADHVPVAYNSHNVSLTSLLGDMGRCATAGPYCSGNIELEFLTSI